MKILGIETSCDETAASIVEDGQKLLSTAIATSSEMHVKTGGIIPEQAARQQVKSIIPIINEALKEGKSTLDEIDALAVTSGPGLIGSLLVGVETAKTLSLLTKKKIVPINHLVAHIYANFIGENPSFPALCLVVSGGHTDMVIMKGHGEIKWIGGTRDDAAGEAFDKTARLLGLPYPGGPSIAKAADKYLERNKNAKLNLFPRPMINDNNFDFSFSGLKTAVLNKVNKKDAERDFLAANIQEAVVDVLAEKTVRAAKKFKPKSILLAGGVAANKRLRDKLEKRIKEENIVAKFFVPPISLCTDNAAYIAACAYFNFNPVPWNQIDANPELSIDGQI